MNTTRAYVAWCVIALVLLGGTLGWQPLRDPDEGRNAEVAREMAVSGDWVLPHLNGLPYLDKPVLYFAMGAASISVLGANEFAARLPGFLAALGTAVLVGLFARRRWGADAGRVAGLATLAAPLPMAFSRIVIMDSTLTFLVVASLLAFHRAVERRRAAREAGETGGWFRGWGAYSLIAWALIGVGILAKGPVALLFPVLIILPYAIWRRQPWAFLHPVGPVVMVAIVAPWLWAVTREVPDLVRYVIDTEIVARVSSDALIRTKPWWYYGPMLLIGGAPWTFTALSRIRRRTGPADPHTVFVGLWVLVPLVLFSLMRTKMPQYLLPTLPAVALVVAYRWSRDPGPARGVKVAAVAWLVLAAILLPWGLGWLPFGEVDAHLADAAALSGVLLGTAFLVSGVAALGVRRFGGVAAAIALSVPVVVLPTATAPVLNLAAAERSGHDLAAAMRERGVEDVELFGIGWWSPSLAFYLERTYPYAAGEAFELGSNYIDHHFERYAQPDGNLRPWSAMDPVLQTCDRPVIVVVGTHGWVHRERVEATGFPVFLEAKREIAYGPGCTDPESPPE